MELRYSPVREAARRWAQDLLGRSDWAILDTETTGLDTRAEVIQIGVLAPDGATLLNTLLRPRGLIPYDAIAIHGITDAMVATAPAYREIQPTLFDLLRGRTVICYNAPFDRRMLEQTARRHEATELPVSWECAMEKYAQYLGQWSGRRGGYQRVSLPRGSRYGPDKHQALDDCLATLDVIRKMAGHPM
jgi:DNA polymerase-3 subunit epsilon